ncbi:maker512 [Drosophila busckii]|uniref:Maker512 n=1 Tax=Drosophila busckii TaxID=30019 RepID=A0A0M4E281_DROBS|nr:maker512 [Drosophila busckii]
MKCNSLIIVLTLSLYGFFKASASNENEHCSASQPIDQECGTKYLKPLILYVHQLQDKLNDNNVDALINEIKELKQDLKAKNILIGTYEFKQLQDKLNNKNVDALLKINEELKNTLKEKNELLDLFKNNIADLRKFNLNLRKAKETTKLQAQAAVGASYQHINNSKDCGTELIRLQKFAKEINEKSSTCHEQLYSYKINFEDLKNDFKNLSNTNQNQTKLIDELTSNSQTEKLQNEIQYYVNEIGKLKKELYPQSCKAFALNPGEHDIKLPGQKPFRVLCSDDSEAGRGWTVMQQRINGKEEFQRDWDTYRDGFGSFDGDFFLGLDKIHHITHSQQHELYIYMQKFNDDWYYARYDNFRVGSEDDLFELQSLGSYDGTYKDRNLLRYSEHVKFTTHDRNNVLSVNNCAKDQMYGGWWYYHCALGNLNGKYFHTEACSSFNKSLQDELAEYKIKFEKQQQIISELQANATKRYDNPPGVTVEQFDKHSNKILERLLSIETQQKELKEQFGKKYKIGQMNKTINALKASLNKLHLEKEVLVNENKQCAAALRELEIPNGFKLYPTNCAAFGSSDTIEIIQTPPKGLYQVPCDSTTAGPGWTVIYFRTNNTLPTWNVDWNEYKTGFGDLVSHYFIGLEKLHLMTKLDFELYVKIETKSYAHYSIFSVGSESESYTLKLGNFTGDYDILSDANNMKFSTHDRDNDNDAKHCAYENSYGWWFDTCVVDNKNIMVHRGVQNFKMMIRPLKQ